MCFAMKIRFLKLKNWVLLTLMGALGVAGCKSASKVSEPEEPAQPMPRDEIRLMYGVPTMNYMIRGQVRDADGRPIKDLRVNMLERNIEVDGDKVVGDPRRVQEYLESTSVSTDKHGRFSIEGRDLPQERVRLLVRDVDGDKGGAYQNKVVEVEVTPDDVDKTNAGGWNQGTFNKEVKIKMENVSPSGE